MSHEQQNPDSNDNEISNRDPQSNTFSISVKCYGGDFYGHLLEEYKLYVEMMDRVSARRINSSQFYISLLSALFGIAAVLIEKKVLSGSEEPFLLLISLLGLLLCFIWYININSYRYLNSLKFQVIQEMEQSLPFPCYAREWQILEKKRDRYWRLSKIEKYVPLVISLLYLGLTFYAGVSLFRQVFKSCSG